MAAPAITSDRFYGSKMRVVTVSQSGANDGGVNIEIARPLVSLTLQVAGTYTSGSIALQGSNDGTTFYALPTTATTLSALGIAIVITNNLGFRYYKVLFASAHADNVIVATVVAKHL